VEGGRSQKNLVRGSCVCSELYISETSACVVLCSDGYRDLRTPAGPPCHPAVGRSPRRPEILRGTKRVFTLLNQNQRAEMNIPRTESLAGSARYTGLLLRTCGFGAGGAKPKKPGAC
jgi:hypothetical protein